MPHFRYIALNDQGREVRGLLDATSPGSAAATLRAQAMFVVSLEGSAGHELPSAPRAEDTSAQGLASFLPVTTRDKIFFLQQLALMLRTGLTILQALEVCRLQSTKRQLASAVGEMTHTIQSGRSLSQAMGGQRRLFSPMTIKLVESAEASGELDEALDRAAVQLEMRADLKRNLITSLTYPAIVVLAAIGVATFLVWTIIPKFATFFARRQMTLPWSTQLLLDTSDFLRAYGGYLLGGLTAALIVLVALWLTARGRLLIDRALLRLPVVGKLLSVASMAQLSRTLSTLLRSGVTLLESLRITAQVVGNRAVSGRIADSAEEILRGRDLSGSLGSFPIPPLVPQVVAVGERTGALSQVLDELAKFYERDLQARIRRMTAMVEPALILVIGVMVGFVYYSFFQAVFQLATAR